MTAGTSRGARASAGTFAGVWLALLALVVGLLPATAASASVPAAVPATASVTETADRSAAQATGIAPMADLTQFRPGNIMSDAVFFNRNTMTAAQIQAFLQARVPSCQAGYICLKDWYDTTRTTTADAMCGPYAGGVRERASTIIYKVAQACGINPQVILATLQKEQSLVTHTWPSEVRFRIAMGQGCPDTAACDTRYYGFFNQVMGAAWQFKRYANPPGTSQFFTWYAPGRTWNIRYNPNVACGSSPVFIQNQATANLYYYTPYQPNAAALRAGYGLGDGCSAYGNRNFYQYFTDWFGSTQTPTGVCDQPAASSVTAAAGEYRVTVALNARRAPTTLCEPAVTTLPAGTIVTRTGVLGEWWRVRVDGAVYWVHGDYLAPNAAVAYSTSRISGPTRYETAVEVSKSAFPGTAPVVFLASGQDFPDALAAAAAAASQGGSLLLTASGALPAPVRGELSRLAPSRVVIIGGTGAVSAAVEAEVAALLPSADTSRLGGEDRFETSRLIARELFQTSAVAYLATGAGFADALAASAVAGAKDAPVLLVNGTSAALDDATIAALRSLSATTVVIAGGPGAVSAGIETALRSAGFAVQRYGGPDRYATSRVINAATYPGAAPTVFLATGTDFPDALAAAVLAGSAGAPLFSVPSTCMSGATKDWLIAHGTGAVRLVGGTGALSDAVLRSERC